MIAAFAILAFIIAPKFIAAILLEEGARSKHWLFWAQTLAGNWSGDFANVKDGVVSAQEFSLAAVIALVLNNFLFFIIVGLIWRIIVERKRNMEMADAIVLRDFLIKESFRDLFEKAADKRTEPLNSGQAASILNAAFQNGYTDLEKHLTSMYGRDEAKNVVGMIKSGSQHLQRA